MHLSTFSSLSSLHLIDAGFYSTPYLKVVPVTNLSAIAPLSQWGLPQLVDYVVNYTLPASSVSIAFCALATFFLLSFIIWRCIRGCFQCCCPNCGATSCDRCCPKSLPATRYSIFTGWISITLKVIALLFSVFIMTDAIYGLATTKDSNNVKGVNLVTEAFSTLDSLMLYVSAIIASSYSVSNQLGIVANASVALTQILNASNITLGTVYGVASSAADASSKLSNTALSFNTSIVSAYYQNQNSWEDSVRKIESHNLKQGARLTFTRYSYFSRRHNNFGRLWSRLLLSFMLLFCF